MNYRSRRLPCQHPVKLSTLRGTVQAVIRNVHDEGARLNGVEDVAPGETCTLTLDGLPVQSTVLWASGDSAGVAFNEKLTRRQLERISGILATPSGAREPRRIWGYTELK